jgi:glutathione S-transferase
MKLYCYKNAGSFAVRIIINELGLHVNYEFIETLQTKDKKTESGEDFRKINPKNQIPALLLDDGRLLTEIIAILHYLSDLKQDDNLTQARNFNKYKVLEWLSFSSSELHKNFASIISPLVPLEAKEGFQRVLMSKLKFADKFLENKDFLVAGVFTLADAYFFTILSWLKFIKIELTGFPSIEIYYNKLKARPSIQKSQTEEGLEL